VTGAAKAKLIVGAALLACSLRAAPDIAKPVDVAELFAPRLTLAMKVKGATNGTVARVGDRWQVSGKSPMRIEFVPAAGAKWNISGFRLLSLAVTNQAAGTATVDGRLNNGKLTSWSRHAVGFAVAPSAQAATLGFPFPVVEGRYTGNPVFADQLAKANGHRTHWRQFFPEDLRVILLDIISSSGDVDMLIDDAVLAWPATEQMDQRLERMPYLDKLGQVRAVAWPGKAASIDEARRTVAAQLKSAADQAQLRRIDQYGGWLDGPKLSATGHFRTEKLDGRWWLVDPQGYLFFSVGACLAGHTAETVINQKRLDAGFFAFLPDASDYLRWEGRKTRGDREFANFPAMNCQRMFSPKWKTRNRDGIHTRMRAWGVNTLAAWSDPALAKDRRTPYTLVASIWWQDTGHRKFPAPFRDDYEADLRQALQRSDWAKDDPYCLGVFIGNELEWPDRITPLLFELPKGHSTKAWAARRMQEKYRRLDALNTAWKTTNSAWDTVLTGDPKRISAAARNDLESLYLEFTTTFFKRSKAALQAALPNTLYLGCRTHRGPNVLGRGALGHVDVFSVNVYDNQVRSWQVPPGADIPIMASEFHFGAVDRGVPSPGLSGSWDQRQRGLAFAHYLASALVEPRFVGVHWFQWIDQSAAGRQDRENHQCGFVDVTGRAYPEFVDLVSKATIAMYPARHSGESDRLKILDKLIR
jgi:hypothetical protein